MSLLSALLLLTHIIAFAAAQSGPSQCISFDANWNLLAFNFNGKDYNAGPQDSFTSSTPATEITTSGRPPFDVSDSPPHCFLSKFTNSVYFLNADASDKSAVYIYDATAKSWSKQATTGLVPKSYHPSTFGAILDHDTNVFYALSAGELVSLNMELLTAATSTPIPWNDVQKPELTATGRTDEYEPVLGLARNHVHFYGVPGLEPGVDKIFVIHYSYLQPEPQSYGTPAFPNTHGKATSFFRDSGVQTKIAFIPDDGSSTYVIDVTTNTTATIPGPSTKDSNAIYTTSPSALVQLSSSGGKVSWIGFNQDTSQGTSWQTLSSLPAVTATDSGKNNGNGTISNAGTGSEDNDTSGALRIGFKSGLTFGATPILALLVASLASFVGVVGL